MLEISAGGIVFYHNSICLLQKFSGDWVLPKGRLEPNETLMEAALREVYEETAIRAVVLHYVGKVSYEYYYFGNKNKRKKTVHWFLMKAKNRQCQPLHGEGFMKAQFIEMHKAKVILNFETEKHMVKKAISLYKGAYE